MHLGPASGKANLKNISQPSPDVGQVRRKKGGFRLARHHAVFRVGNA